MPPKQCQYPTPAGSRRLRNPLWGLVKPKRRSTDLMRRPIMDSGFVSQGPHLGSTSCPVPRPLGAPSSLHREGTSRPARRQALYRGAWPCLSYANSYMNHVPFNLQWKNGQWSRRRTRYWTPEDVVSSSMAGAQELLTVGIPVDETAQVRTLRRQGHKASVRGYEKSPPLITFVPYRERNKNRLYPFPGSLFQRKNGKVTGCLPRQPKRIEGKRSARHEASKQTDNPVNCPFQYRTPVHHRTRDRSKTGRGAPY